MTKYIGRTLCDVHGHYCGVMECPKGHRYKVCNLMDGTACPICDTIEELKLEEYQNGNY